MRFIADAKTDRRPPIKPRWRTVIGLLDVRQRVALVLLTGGRITVGVCDLALATAMYLLFLLLQGHTPAQRFWWAPRTLLAAALLTAALVVLRAAADVFSSRAASSQIQRLGFALLLRLTEGYSEMQWRRFVKLNRSELSSHALLTAREAADFYHRCIELLAGVVIVAIMTAAFVCQSLVSAACFAGALATFYCAHRLIIRKKVQQSASNREKALSKLRRNIADMLLSGKEIRTYGNLEFFQERIRRQAERAAASSASLAFLPQVARTIADQGAVLVFLGIVVVIQLRQGDASQLLSLLVFYFVLSRRLIPLISQISYIAGQMEGSYENVKILDAELEKCRKYRTVALPAHPPDANLVMQVNQVSFSYLEGWPILRDVNLCMRNGETIVLHGASGIGKSSLLNLIAGVLQPATGTIRVDRASIAYVPQETPLLDDSIRNNLLFGLPGRRDEELMKALETANLDEFVTTLPLGLDAGVGDNGALFSGGQRQRLGLARAILRGSQLLLLDEATSALDEESERQVFANLNASGMAILLATHRAQARTFAHRIFRLEDGSLVEETIPSMPIDMQILSAVP